MTQTARLGLRAARTRSAILEVAEALFAERGFAATRLEDVAERVGIRRASIVYYFKDKRELYDAVLKSAFGGLLQEIEGALSRHETLDQRVEAGVSAWVDYVGKRPTIARLVLREMADAAPDDPAPIVRHIRPFLERLQNRIFEHPGEHGAPLLLIDPLRLASTIAGATVFFVAALPALVPHPDIDPLRPEQLETHREEMLRIAGRLLGGPRPRRTGSAQG